MSNATAPLDMSFCHGIGQYHSPTAKTNPKPLLTIGWVEIVAMAKNPESVDKKDGPWVIPSSLLSRSFKEQEPDGLFGMLWFDFDENPPIWSAVHTVIREWSPKPFDCVYYHTRSATGERKKCRLLILLSEAVSGREWLMLQQIGNQKFIDAGITPDHVNERAAQLCYLPNKGEYYHPEIIEGQGFFEPSLWWEEIAALDELATIQKEQDAQAKLTRERERELKRAAGLTESDDRNTIVLFNQLFTVEDVLLDAGYDQRGSHFRHPNSKSGGYSASVKEDEDGVVRVFSLSSEDPLFVKEGTRPGRAHTAFSAFTVLNHRGVLNDALKDAADNRIQIDGESLNKVKRRERQREQARKIGEDGFPDGDERTTPDQLTINTMLRRFVFLQDGSRVADLDHPRWSLALNDFKNAFAGSKELIGKDEIPVSKLWVPHIERMTRFSLTFRAGAGRFTDDPEGRPCVNTWRSPLRVGPVGDPTPFLDHVRWLFAERAEDFLDWLAHLEQRPEELPHTAWVHVATSTGLGRNWLASFLARLWPGQTATNFDLSGTLDKGFNGRLAGKVLAQVDEIREGGGQQRWTHQEKLKSLVNAEIREIKPKYGREYVEWNACRWLIFSNSESAIPLESNDRRFEVVICRESPQDPHYYSWLYPCMGDLALINGVADFLQNRTIPDGLAGRRAKDTADKQVLRQSSMSEYDQLAIDLVEGWPCDVILSPVLTRYFLGQTIAGLHPKGLPPGAQHALQDVGARSGGEKKVRTSISPKPERFWILRNAERWVEATTDDLKYEILRYEVRDHEDPRRMLTIGV